MPSIISFYVIYDAVYFSIFLKKQTSFIQRNEIEKLLLLCGKSCHYKNWFEVTVLIDFRPCYNYFTSLVFYGITKNN